MRWRFCLCGIVLSIFLALRESVLPSIGGFLVWANSQTAVIQIGHKPTHCNSMIRYRGHLKIYLFQIAFNAEFFKLNYSTGI
jgi:hypothetical protein